MHQPWIHLSHLYRKRILFLCGQCNIPRASKRTDPLVGLAQVDASVVPYFDLLFSRVTLQTSESRLPASSIQRVASSLSGQMTKPAGFVRLEWNHLAASRRTTGLCVSSWTCWYHFACRDLIFCTRCTASLPHGSVRFFKMTRRAVQNARQGLFCQRVAGP